MHLDRLKFRDLLLVDVVFVHSAGGRRDHGRLAATGGRKEENPAWRPGEIFWSHVTERGRKGKEGGGRNLLQDLITRGTLLFWTNLRLRTSSTASANLIWEWRPLTPLEVAQDGLNEGAACCSP